jgi:hypothetical protein
MPDVSGYTQFSNNERLYVGFEELEQARNLAASEIAAEQLSVRGWGR